MNTPQPPQTDDEVQRHKFYGSMSSAFMCMIDRQDHNDGLTREVHDQLFSKYGRIKDLIEETNSRINKRTYQNDFEKLEIKVNKLESNDVAHRTAWSTGKMFIIGAWLVFTVLMSWGYSMLNLQIKDYVKTIDANEKVINVLRNDVDKLNTTMAENMVKHENFDDVIKDINASQDYNKQKSKELWQLLNRLSLEDGNNK